MAGQRGRNEGIRVLEDLVCQAVPVASASAESALPSPKGEGSFDKDVINCLRDMARRGDSVGAMFKELKKRLGPETHILTILGHMRSAFHLTLAEAKPLAALSRTDQREIVDETLLQELVMPAIEKHRSEWDT